MNEEDIKKIVQEELEHFMSPDKFIFQKGIQIFDGRNIVLGKTTGTKVGTETTQKIGFFNTTPVVQQSKITDASAPGSSYVQAEQITQTNAINKLIDALEAFGLTASS